MMQQYHKAFSIFFKHDFFPDGNLRSLTVKPTTETKLTLRNNGGILVPFQYGIHVLYDSLYYGNERLRTEFLESAEHLNFLVMNNDHNFYNYTTAFNTDISCNYFLFTNTGNANLHAGNYVGKDDIRAVDTRDNDFFSKPFGIIDIQLHNALQESLQISFSTVSTYWCYVLSTDYLQELINPAILDKETQELFSGPETAQLTENKTALLFFSKNPITHYQRVVHTFQLVEDYHPEQQSYKVVLPVLPGPSPRYISSVKIAEEYKDKDISFIFI
ncbi:hypothetical protein H7F33_05310 [Pedobacter sp. PAMC26386]|nr:hypothetical protein H7F33_05310 [Pedobacter sp. PAMC26386]